MTCLEAMKQAIEALEYVNPEFNVGKAITSLRTAIEEVEKAEPIGECQLRKTEAATSFVAVFYASAIINGQVGHGVSLYTHPRPITVPENLDEIALNVAANMKGYSVVDVVPEELHITEFARRLVAKLQEQGK